MIGFPPQPWSFALCQLDLIAIDLWQLGAVAFYALTGSHPYETSALVVYTWQAGGKPKWPGDLRVIVSPQKNLRWQWKKGNFKMNCPLKMGIFPCHVSFQGGGGGVCKWIFNGKCWPLHETNKDFASENQGLKDIPFKGMGYWKKSCTSW